MEPSASPRRILALWLPRLSTDRLKRRWKASGRLDKRPLVVAGKIDNALRLTAVDAEAARLGLYAGKALADARAMIPNLAVMRANEVADRKLLEAIADWCERYTPLVGLDAPQGLFLDVTGVTHLFGSERGLLDKIASAIERQGFSVGLALAGTAEAAQALARYRHGTIVAPGGEAEAVAPLVTQALNADPHIIHALKRAGLKTIGQVAERKRYELAARFGANFVALLDRTLGRRSGPITPRTSLPDLMAERRFAEPIVTEDIIMASLLSLGQSIAAILEARGQGARRLEACFFRADGEMRRITIETARPTRDAKAIARLFREKLDALADPLDPGFGFDLIRLSAVYAENVKSAIVSLDADQAEEDVRFLVDQLAARFGAHRVLRFQPQDTHIPEAAALAVPAQHVKPTKLPWEKMRRADEAPCRPLRLFNNPQPVEVISEVPDGPPLKFRWRCALHTVSHAEGPERIAMEWWRHQSPEPTRDYFRVEDDAGRRFWLYRDGTPRETVRSRWFMHGLFA